MSERITLQSTLLLGVGLGAIVAIALVGPVAHWARTESLGAGDLRPYAIVQFLPMLLIPLTIIL